MHRPSLGLAVISLLGCNEVTPSPTEAAPRRISATNQAVATWSSLSADVTVSREVLNPATGIITSPSGITSYSIQETKTSAGWTSEIFLKSRDQSRFPEAMRVPAQSSEIGRIRLASRQDVEFLTRAGEAKALVAPTLPQWSFLPNGGRYRAMAPRRKPVDWTRSRSLTTEEKPSSLSRLITDPVRVASLRQQLVERYGPPIINAEGAEVFRSQSVDIVRTIVFDPALGVEHVRVDVGGAMKSSLKYSFGTLAPGVSGIVAIVIEQSHPKLNRALQRTTVRYTNARFGS